MHIVVISHSFPTSKTIDFIFVDQLCRQFANKGEKITIIAPQSLTKCLFRGIPISKKKSIIKIPILYLFFFSYINKNTASTNPITGLNKIKYMKSIGIT